MLCAIDWSHLYIPWIEIATCCWFLHSPPKSNWRSRMECTAKLSTRPTWREGSRRKSECHSGKPTSRWLQCDRPPNWKSESLKSTPVSPSVSKMSDDANAHDHSKIMHALFYLILQLITHHILNHYHSFHFNHFPLHHSIHHHLGCLKIIALIRHLICYLRIIQQTMTMIVTFSTLCLIFFVVYSS